MGSLSCACLLQEFERSRAFGFLNEVKKRFQTTYGSRAQTALPYAMNSEFSSTLAAQMVRIRTRFTFKHDSLFIPCCVCLCGEDEGLHTQLDFTKTLHIVYIYTVCA